MEERPFAETENDGTGSVRCSRCGAEVPPGPRCPYCGCVLPGNRIAAKSEPKPETAALATAESRAAFVAALLEERGGRDAVDATEAVALATYATAVVHLRETERDLDRATGKQRQVLLATFATLSKRVEELRPAPPRPRAADAFGERPHAPADTLAGPVAAEALALLERLEALLGAESAGSARNSGPATGDEAAGTTNADRPDLTAVRPAAHGLAGPTGFPAESDGPGAELPDLELMARDPAAWRVVHGNHPSEVERRRAEATRVMLARIGQPSLLEKL